MKHSNSHRRLKDPKWMSKDQARREAELGVILLRALGIKTAGPVPQAERRKANGPAQPGGSVQGAQG
jgi:hypothetical protein